MSDKTYYLRNVNTGEFIPITMQDLGNDLYAEQAIFMGKTGDDTYQAPRLDVLTHALAVIDYPHKEIHAGSHFKAGNFSEALDNSDTLAIAFTTPAGTKHAHFEMLGSSVGACRLQLFKGATVTGGTPATPENRNHNSSNTSILTVVLDPTVSAQGTEIEINWIGGTGFKTTIGGGSRSEQEIILAESTTYLVLLTALADGVFAKCGGDWYEHTDKEA